MIETFDTGSPKVVGFELTDKRRDEDYEQLAQVMTTIMTAEGRVRLFVRYEDFPGWDLYAAWDDFKLTLRHECDFERIAMVGDLKWKNLMEAFCEPFTHAAVRYFGKPEIDAAWKWLRE